MKFKPKEAGMIKELLKEIKEMDKRLSRVERAVPVEILTKSDLRAIKKSEEEIRKGKYVTAEQLKKELGIK
ncbi:MAG: hypothetical protein HY361_00740 [Candidatus Aenigmarchaeota archaeon]|nr:hypothetical protein [Candidatus Aenigmarchaeota archaeon]